LEDEESAPATAHAGDTGVYRRADVEGFAEWARTTIAHLQAELADAQRQAAAAEHALIERHGLDAMFERAALAAADAAADAAAKAAVDRVEALLDEARAKARGEQIRPAPADDEPSTHDVSEELSRDPLIDPLPRWNDRLRAFPEERSDLPPIGPIFENDTHRTG
jgi:hypothetical protein